MVKSWPPLLLASLFALIAHVVLSAEDAASHTTSNEGDAAAAAVGNNNATDTDVHHGELGQHGEKQHGEDEEEHHGTHEVYAVLLPWVVQSLGVVTFYVLTRYLHALPYTAVMFILGIFMGLGANLSGVDDQLTESIKMWTGIDSEVLFTVFLPGLLFKDALEINFHLFQASIYQLLSLAFPLVLAGTFLTAAVAMYVFPYGWSFHQCLTFGAILAATDPVAVSALLNEVGAPPRLKVHVSGESLLNDGSAVVFFFVFGGLFLNDLGITALAGDATTAEAFKVFFKMSLGGVCVGLAYALALVLILYKLDRRMEPEETVLQVAATVTIAYLSFYTSEVVCEMSGVIAVVITGITTKAYGGGMISDWKVMDSFWVLVEHLLNTVIFALGGIEFGYVITRQGWDGVDWGFLFVLYLFLNAIRFFLNFAFYPINTRIGLGTNWQETVFASWGGLRGAVGITLALALDNYVIAGTEENDPNRILTTKMFGMVGGIALLTLVINGTSCGPLLAKLGLADSTESRERIVKCAEEAMRRRVLDDFLHLMTDRRFYFVDYALIVHHCPLLRDLTADELQTAIKLNKESVHPSLYKSPNLDYVLPYIKDSGAVRTSIMTARQSVFTAPVTAAELELGAVEEEGGDGEEAALAASADLIRDTRLMFVELLRAAYTAQISDGELDPREYDGFLVTSLFQSLDFAHDAVSSGKPLNDWTLAQIGTASTEFVNKTEDYANRVLGCCCAKPKEGPRERLQLFRDHERYQYQQLRLGVLRALSFIDAHKEAQDRLQDEFGGGSGEAASAFRIVMNESKAEQRKAKQVLASQNKKKLKHVISHYLCVILQNKTARYVKLLLDSGVLLQREARHILEQVDEHIREIRKCPLDKHPGSIDFADQVDYQEGRPRRKRVKQKSIL